MNAKAICFGIHFYDSIQRLTAEENSHHATQWRLFSKSVVLSRTDSVAASAASKANVMMRFLFLLTGFFGVVASTSLAQSALIPLNTDYYHLIDRTEIRRGHWAEGFHSSIKPYARQGVVQLTDSLLADPRYNPSESDLFNVAYLRDDSWEWVSTAPNPGVAQKPFLNVIFQKKADLYSTQTEDFDIHASPVLGFGIGNDRVSPNAPSSTNPVTAQPFLNTRGFELRGNIRKRLSFYSYFADNQAIYPFYVQQYSNLYGRPDTALAYAPGEGLAKKYKTVGADFFSARGYITFNALKIINIQFGHDRNFIGNGYRSLLLSDNSAPYTFLKIITRFGRFQYTNLFAELQNSNQPRAANQLIQKKYAAMHHLSMNLGERINVGLFEAEVFSRDQLEVDYLNPIIFYRYIESFRGSADNAFIGIDAKGLVGHNLLIYTQLMLDEFVLNKLRFDPGSWVNKFAFQFGAKYVNVLGVPNLDIQGEFNSARPYTYAHFNSQTNYTNYSQPLAHPLGANFMEGLGIVRFQARRLTANALFGVIKYGVDPFSDQNYGGNIGLNYDTRVRSEGNFIGQGRTQLITYADMRLSYMVRHNVFLDLRYYYRFLDSQYKAAGYTEQTVGASLRWNLAYQNLTF